MSGGWDHMKEKSQNQGNLRPRTSVAVRTSVYVTYSQSRRGRFALWDTETQT